MKDGYAIVSKIIGSFGLKGEAKCSIETDIIENITKQKGFFLRKGSKRIFLDVEYIKVKPNYVIMKFKGVDTPEAVKSFKGWFLEVKYEDLVPLEEGKYYRFQLIGLKVYTSDGEFIGTLEDIIATSGHDVYVVVGEKEVLIPSVMVKEINLSSGKMIVDLLEGLL